MRINNNISAINTHRQMGIHVEEVAKSMERLSSGYRINRAGDDAAGLAISEKMRAQIRGLTMASKNAQDTISMIQTAEGALAETHSILQRIRELAVQSANDTNTDSDRSELQAEVKQLLAEVNRIGNTTEFNTKKLLEGSAKGVSDEVKGTLRVNNNSSLVLDPAKIAKMGEAVAGDRSWAFEGAYALVRTGMKKEGEFNAEDFMLVGPNGAQYKFATLAAGGADAGVSVPGVIIFAERNIGAGDAYIQFSSNAGVALAADYKNMAVGDIVTFIFSRYQPPSSNLADSFMAQIGANSGQTTFIPIGDMRAQALGAAGIDISTKWGAATAIETIDNAIQMVSRQRSALGAFQNRLEHTISSLEIAIENLQAAESRIRDVDMMKEIMEFTKNSILLQVSQAMLAQANSQPKRILELLRDL